MAPEPVNQLARMAHDERECYLRCPPEGPWKTKTEVLAAEMGVVIKRALKSAKNSRQWAEA